MDVGRLFLVAPVGPAQPLDSPVSPPAGLQQIVVPQPLVLLCPVRVEAPAGSSSVGKNEKLLLVIHEGMDVVEPFRLAPPFHDPLFLALVMVEFTDLIFAVDSIPAIFAITADPFLVFTSNVFAILGLRSLYFALAGMIHQFRYLKVALAVVLMVVGVKMMTHAWLKAFLGAHFNLYLLGVVLLILGALAVAAIIAGLIIWAIVSASRGNKPPAGGAGESGDPVSAPASEPGGDAARCALHPSALRRAGQGRRSGKPPAAIHVQQYQPRLRRLVHGIRCAV